jgi:hypothetical protein
MKTRVIVNQDDPQYNEFKKGEVGYIDGYVRGGEGIPYAAVVIEDRIQLIAFRFLTVSKEH